MELKTLLSGRNSERVNWNYQLPDNSDIIGIVRNGIKTALTLTPALCALMLKPGLHKPKPVLAFDRFFDKVTTRYVGMVSTVIKRALRFMLTYAVILAGVFLLFKTIPGGFVTEEDKGTMFVGVDLPAGASPERVIEVMKRAEAIARTEPSVKDIIGIPGFSFFYRYSNQGFLYVTLKPWAERKEAEQHVSSIIRRLNGKFYMGISEARVFAINEPPLRHGQHCRL